jgi:hypothetical protein
MNSISKGVAGEKEELGKRENRGTGKERNAERVTGESANKFLVVGQFCFAFFAKTFAYFAVNLKSK